MTNDEYSEEYMNPDDHQEVEVEIYETSYTTKDGSTETQQNIAINKDKKNGQPAMPEDGYIFIEKLFPDGLEIFEHPKYGSTYACKAKYKGEEVTFLLNEKQHDAYKQAGGEGDKVRVSNRWIRNSRDQAFLRKEFEKVE